MVRTENEVRVDRDAHRAISGKQSERATSRQFTISALALLLASSGAIESVADEASGVETERTLARFEQSPHFKYYTALERGQYAHWKRDSDARYQALFGPQAQLHEGWIYQFRDSRSGRWSWRRQSVESFVKGGTAWETLATWKMPEGEKVQRPTAVCLRERCMVTAPSDDPDVTMWREFDLNARRFVDGGFNLQADDVLQVLWQSKDAVIVRRANVANRPNAGETVVRWQRGKPIEDAQVLLNVEDSRDWIWMHHIEDAGGNSLFVIAHQQHLAVEARRKEMERGDLAPMPSDRVFWRLTASGDLDKLHLPSDAYIVGVHEGQIIIRRDGYGGRIYGDKKDWHVGGKPWKNGSILSIPLTDISLAMPEVYLVSEPRSGQSYHVGTYTTKDCLVVRTTEFLRSRMRCYRFREGRWRSTDMDFPVEYSQSFASVVSDPSSSIALTSYQTMLQPPTPFAVDTRSRRTIELPHHLPIPFDDPGTYVMRKLEAVSSDGTKVPYFVAHTKELRLDGNNPTMMWFYGAWGVPELPAYEKYCAPGYWLQRGGVCVLANIRGGTEMGPEWYVKGLERRHVYDDIIAVAEDLIRRRISSPKKLGMLGHTYYGGLAAAVVAQIRPDLFNAAVIEGGILDLFDPAIRDDYELGSPEIPAERAFLESTSPIQSLRENGREWPVLIIAYGNGAMADMALRYSAKSKSLGIPYYLYVEGLSGTKKLSIQTAIYTYLAERLM